MSDSDILMFIVAGMRIELTNLTAPGYEPGEPTNRLPPAMKPVPVLTIT